MNTGTKSLLFGVHQIFIHPLVVLLAWVKLYGMPNWKEIVCIIIHDWGYWGKKNMDDEAGERHPEWAAGIAHRLFDRYDQFVMRQGHPMVINPKKYHDLCLYHSRHYARNAGREPSKLCWADKLSILYEPWWFYLPRAWASGELKEYRILAAKAEFVPTTKSHKDWYKWIQEKLAILAREQKGDAVPYANKRI